MSNRRALVTGASGFIGGRLVPRLLEAGFTVRVLVRNADKLKDVPWRSRVDIVEGGSPRCQHRQHCLRRY